MIVRGRDPVSGQNIRLTIAHGRIASVEPSAAAIEDEPWLAAGLVDLQLNGFNGLDLNDGACDWSRVVALCHAVAHTGTTTFLPTLITAPQQTLLQAASAIREARARDHFAAHVIAGIHLEGPAISPLEGFRGAHPEASVRPPLLEQLLEIDESSGGCLRLITLSPHWPDAPACIRALTARGIACAIGHTHATSVQISAAVDAGARLSTHLGNGLPLSLARHHNPMWPQLADDRLHISLIADGAHLPSEVLQVMLRAKGLARCILVSDAVAVAGMPPGLYQAPIGGTVQVDADSAVRMYPSGLLAGSGVSLATAVARSATLARITLAQALSLATAAPAALLGLDRGTLRPGSPADLITFTYSPGDAMLSLQQVIVQGRPLNHFRSPESA